MDKIISNIDHSINYVSKEDIGTLEARYVRRNPTKVSIYVSSQTGCDHACRMCHLTSSKQTKYRDTSIDEFQRQFNTVFMDVPNKELLKRVHVNFMARGEPLSNIYIQQQSTSVLRPMLDAIMNTGVSPRFCISTIMPVSIADMKLTDIFNVIHPELYYSLYSNNVDMRKRWLPKSLPVEQAITKLVEWQQFTNKIPRIHFPFIKDVNDNEQEIVNLVEIINKQGLKVNVNIPAYNPNENGGTESENHVIVRNVKILEEGLACKVKLIPKVGFDVKASCGMFV